jgi:RpiR family transcriptional regulator, repressor of rpiB and als operon
VKVDHSTLERSAVYRANPRALIVTIQGLLPSATPAERAIASVLLDARATNEAGLRLAHVAVIADVSEAAVVKFAKRLGFTGFRDMRDVLLAYRRLHGVDLHEELSFADDTATVVRKVFATAAQALADTQAIFDFAPFERAAAALHRAPNRLLFGVGGSATIARDFEHKLLRIGVASRAFDDPHLMAMAASLLSPLDAVVAISHSGGTSALVEACEIAAERGAAIIAVTNTAESKLAHLAGAVLVSASQGSPITGENAASRIAQLTLLDALFVRVAQLRGADALRNLEATMGSVARKRLS